MDGESENGGRVVGEVTSGVGKGKHFVSLEGYVEQFREELGYEPFPGTLNVNLDGDKRDLLEGVDSIPIEPFCDGGDTYGAAYCYPATLEGRSDGERRPVHVLVPRRTDHDTSVLEVIAPVNLRESLDLSDGTPVTVVVKQ